MHNYIKRIGFTLAEVLITLGIIGVVAALTLPTLISKTQEQENLVGLKKASSVLSQALLKSTLENGSYDNWNINEYNMHDVFKTHFKPYMEVIKDCGIDKEGCWSKTKLLNNQTDFNGWLTSYGIGSGVYTFTLKDGMNINLDCWVKESGIKFMGVTEDMQKTHSIVVDVNGNKKPNQMGRDVFIFVLTSKGLIPAGSDNNSLNCTTSKHGYDCAAKVLHEDKFTY